MSELRYAYDPDEAALRGAARGLLESMCTQFALSATYDDDLVGPAEIWRSVRDDLGLGGLLVDGAHTDVVSRALGFAGVVAEELGRSVAPVPFLTSSVLAATVANELDAPAVRSAIESGRTAAVALPWSTSYADMVPAFSIADDHTLTGRVSHVAGAMEADVLLVPASAANGVLEIHAVDLPASGVERRLISALDMTRPLAEVTLTSVASTRHAVGEEAARALRRALAVATITLGSEQLGLCDAVFTSTADYLRTRRQFGRELGSFQALKHRVADLWVDLEGLRAVARYGALAEEESVEYRASLVAAYASDVAVQLVEECLQLHGGIAMTWEHSLHYVLKRAKADQIALGTAGRHRELLAEIVDLPAAVS
ncbi:acyl-CoA dehydrogenase family protein [Marmoricola sp. RAF53]|uniref:acyl-CoA dehydrogenase family protein n=1 Tax=Marmoricola sp. RAF53 TaxID=3233059 RepID=UPI003F9D6648